MIKIIFKHKEEERAVQAATAMCAALQGISGLQVQGPVPAMIPRVRNAFVQELWLKMPAGRADAG